MKKVPHIIFVDDELNWIYTMKEIGNILGFKITITTDPNDVPRFLANGEYDLLVTDIRMPEESGFDLIRKVRRKYKKLPIIIVTGFETNKLHRQAKALNVQKVMIKPFRISDLENIIARLLNIKIPD
ncbi:response regulator [bacterium]|nr:response regulator [bacterium]